MLSCAIFDLDREEDNHSLHEVKAEKEIGVEQESVATGSIPMSFSPKKCLLSERNATSIMVRSILLL